MAKKKKKKKNPKQSRKKNSDCQEIVLEHWSNEAFISGERQKGVSHIDCASRMNYYRTAVSPTHTHSERGKDSKVVGPYKRLQSQGHFKTKKKAYGCKQV